MRRMRLESIAISPRNRLASFPWEHLAPLVYLAVMLLFYPYRNIFEGDTDEGINLMKAFLVERGFPLYRAIWSDQPPLFTQLLAGSFKLFGLDVNVGRTLVLVFSALLVWGLVVYVKQVWGGWPALTALVLVVLLPFFPQLSTLTLIGLPAISLAVLSLAAIVLWHKNQAWFWLAVSAVLCSLSILIKLFTGVLAPIILVGLVLEGLASTRKAAKGLKLWLPALVWGAIFGLLSLGLTLLMVGPGNLQQLLAPHLSSQNMQAFQANIPSFSIESYLIASWPLLLLALIGVIFALRQRRWLAMYPLAWMLAAYLLLKWNSPVWYHHQLLVTMPAVMLAAGAVGELGHLPFAIRQSSGGRFSWASFALWLPALILTGVLLAQRLPVVVPEFTRTPTFILQAELDPPKELRIVREIERRANETDWMVTDLPIYAFRAGIPVPPELAVFSSKRVAAGDINESSLLAIIDRYNPRLILWGRFDFPELRAQLAERYRQVYALHGNVLYVRND